MKEVNLDPHTKSVHGKPKLIKGERDISKYINAKKTQHSVIEGESSTSSDTQHQHQQSSPLFAESMEISCELQREENNPEARARSDEISADDNKLDLIITK